MQQNSNIAIHEIIFFLLLIDDKKVRLQRLIKFATDLTDKKIRFQMMTSKIGSNGSCVLKIETRRLWRHLGTKYLAWIESKVTGNNKKQEEGAPSYVRMLEVLIKIVRTKRLQLETTALVKYAESFLENHLGSSQSVILIINYLYFL